MSVKFNAVVEISVDEEFIKPYDNGEIPYEQALSAIINDALNKRGNSSKTKVYRHNMFERLNENAEDYLIRDAKEEIENEILNSKMCIGGSCED